MAKPKLAENGSRFQPKWFTVVDDDGDLEAWGETAGECIHNHSLNADEYDSSVVVEVGEYTLTSVKKYKLKYEAEEAN